MYKEKKILLTLLLASACINTGSAQWLEVKSEKDERSISIKVKNGVPSSRVIVSSSLPLSYSSNMGDVTNETVGYGVVNGMNSDTIYFYLADDYKRTLTISAEGYPPITVPFVLEPKETYRCFVFDPNKKNEEVSPSVNTAQWQFTMAQNFDFGRDGFSEDQVEALNWYTKAADQGHGMAQVTLGIKYASGGDGFAKDVVKSARWFLIAAQQNYDTAQYAIANCFLQGKGVKKDMSKAYYWFQQSADKGIDEARYKMANMLLDGYGSDDEVDSLLEWFAFFADENRSEAQYVYAKLLLVRKFSPENEVLAIEYLNKSIALSNVDAMLFLSERCFNKDFDQYNVIKGMELLRMAEDLNSMDAKKMIEQYAQSLSREEVYIYTKHFADSGNAVDMASLANMYYAGDGTPVNYDDAFKYFLRSSGEEDIDDAYIGLGLCYYYGFGVNQDYDKAFVNLNKGSNGGKSIAISALGQCYYYGNGVAKNRDKAFELFTKSNDSTNGTAINGLGLCYYSGEPVVKDMNKALTLFEEALKLDEYNAGLSLGDYYMLESNFSPNKASEYYTIAANVGNPEAQNKLGLLIFKQGIEEHIVNKGKDAGVTFVMPNEEVVNRALEWFKKSSDRNYFKGQYNYAYCLIAALSDDKIVGSDRGKQSAAAFRTLAEAGHKEAMIALASYVKFDVGVDIAEAYEWSKKAADGDAEDPNQALYKGLLGCLEFDKAEAIADATGSTKDQIQSASAVTMEDAANSGCMFVYTRLYTYLKDIKRDKKNAKIWSKRIDLITEEQKSIPVVVSFKI